MSKLVDLPLIHRYSIVAAFNLMTGNFSVFVVDIQDAVLLISIEIFHRKNTAPFCSHECASDLSISVYA